MPLSCTCCPHQFQAWLVASSAVVQGLGKGRDSWLDADYVVALRAYCVATTSPKKMTPADISLAQRLAAECLKQNYKNCGR